MGGAQPGKPELTLPDHVLIVEDNAVLAMAMEDCFRDAGIPTVESCATTHQAMALLRTEKPDVVILDVHLADSDDGWAIAELVQSLKPNAPQIIFSTGAPEDIPAGIAEMGPVMRKPFEAKELLDLMRRPRKEGLLNRLKNAIS
ncbi:response regulator transcription factor [Qipengyuania atrilutea]|uniref:Response regulator n=1 Tax=Qipengyuania atrilutea TaxID=2744473 RepID=A0A850GZG7_9SPHN|nr:response regulator [Actirhodobacter atriluteus]NVD45054.1 response regulator [Actirhodobacter atriluteus]